METSQRIVDTLLRALAKAAPERVPAASAGTMSNLTIGGVDARTGSVFTYYETTAGGMGASATGRWAVGCADAHDELAEYAGGGVGVCVSAADDGAMGIGVGRVGWGSIAAAMGW